MTQDNFDIRHLFGKRDLFSIGCAISDCEAKRYNCEYLKSDIEFYLSVLIAQALAENNSVVCPKGTNNLCVVSGDSAVLQYVGILLNERTSSMNFAKDLNNIGDYIVTNFTPYSEPNSEISVDEVVDFIQGLDTSIISILTNFSCNIIVLPALWNGSDPCEIILPAKSKPENKVVYNIVLHAPAAEEVDSNILKKAIASAISTAIFDFYRRSGGGEWETINRFLVRAYDVMPENHTFHTDVLYRKDDKYYGKRARIDFYPAYVPFAADMCCMSMLEVGTVAGEYISKAKSLIRYFFEYRESVHNLIV